MEYGKQDHRVDTSIGVAQKGAGLLGIVALMGIVVFLAQAGVFYRAKMSARFLGSEKNKILSQQMAEAGVEENIADLGSRIFKPGPGTDHHATYTDKALGVGTFTSYLTTVATGADADTVELSSRGRVASSEQTVTARLRLKKYLDTTRTPIMIVTPVTTMIITTRTVPDTTFTTTVQDPMTMPAINTTPAYSACMSSAAKKCDVCHIPGGDLTKTHVINTAKSAINTHISHHGDYVTTDGTCDIYQPRSTPHITTVTVQDTAYTTVDNTVYDTTVVIDTAVKVQILSWR